MARRTTPLLLGSTMLGTMDSNALVPIIALYAEHVGADVVMTGIIVGLFSAVHAPANLLFGRIADRFGRKLPLGAGLAWDSISLFLYSLATTPLLLAAVRISHGIGSGLVGPSSMALMADTSPRERRGRAMGLYGMALALAVVIGFGIAGPVVDRLGYSALFYVLAAGSALGLVLTLPIREPSAWPVRPRAWGRLLRHARLPGPAAGYASMFSLYFILGAFVTLVPLHLKEQLAFGPLAVGLSFASFAVLSLLLHYPAGIVADRFGPAVPAFVGLLAVAVAMALIPLVRDLTTLLPFMAPFGVGHGFIFPSASSLVTRGSEAEQHGLVTGLLYALLAAGVVIGAPLMAAVASRTTFSFGIWASAWISFLGVAFVARSLVSGQGPSPELGTSAKPAGRG